MGLTDDLLTENEKTTRPPDKLNHNIFRCCTWIASLPVIGITQAKGLTCHILNCMYSYSIGLAIDRYDKVFGPTHNDGFGLMSENNNRRQLLIAISVLGQTAATYGSAHETYWSMYCNFTIQECDLNTSNISYIDFFVSLAILAISAILSYYRYTLKTQQQDHTAKLLIKHTSTQPIPAPELINNLTKVKAIRQNKSIATLSYSHKILRMIIGFYTGLIISFRSRLLMACLHHQSICHPEDFLEKNTFFNIMMTIGFALLGTAYLKSDQQSAYNQAAESRILESLRQMHIKRYDQLTETENSDEILREIPGNLDDLIESTITRLNQQSNSSA